MASNTFPWARKMSTIAPSARDLSGQEKLDDINRILDALEIDLKQTNILPPRRNEILEQLKAHTRAPEDAAPLFTERGVSIICRQSFEGSSPTTGRIAMRCLGNVMYHSESARQSFVDLGYATEAAECMKNDNREDELLASRLLFLCTYGTSLDFEPLFSQFHLADIINTNLIRHAKYFAKTKGQSSPPPAEMLAVNETLKLLYNLTNFYPNHAPDFTKSLLSIVKMLQNAKIPSPPLQPPINSLINSLIHLDLEDKKARYFTQNPLFPLFDTTCNVEQLTNILKLSLEAYSDEDADNLASPLVQVILKISEFAPPNAKAHLRMRLLPSDAERDRALGCGDSLSARLLRLSAAPLAPHMRQFIPALLFELSDKDASRFVKNVGYGFAAGFLVSRDMPVPASALEAWSTTADQGGEGGARVVEIDSDEEGRLNSSAAVDQDIDETDRLLQEEEKGGAAAQEARMNGERTGSISSPDMMGIKAGGTSSVKKPPVGGMESDAKKKKKPAAGAEINPITGQRRDMEPDVAMPHMTEDEKLREAERLFVLFESSKLFTPSPNKLVAITDFHLHSRRASLDRLRATGVVDIENPVTKAAREGSL